MASIVKRKNRYSVVYTYKDDDGNQHQKWETFDTNADAKKRKTQIEFEQQSGTFIIPNATVDGKKIFLTLVLVFGVFKTREVFVFDRVLGKTRIMSLLSSTSITSLFTR